MKPIIYQVLYKDAGFEWLGRAQSKKSFGGSFILFGKLLYHLHHMTKQTYQYLQYTWPIRTLFLSSWQGG